MDNTYEHSPAPSSELRIATRIRLAAAGFSAAVGVIVLFGWAYDLTTLTQILPGLTAMNPLTAMSFVVAGTALALHSRVPSWCISALGGVVFAIGAAKLSQFALGYSHGVDELLFTAKLDDAIGVQRNQMAPNTALALFLIGLALGASKSRSKYAVFVFQSLSLIVVAIALFALVGYVLDIVPLYGIKSFTLMALHTAIA